MANYNKSFNFRNGVQVDDDNFVVNSNGLVGIGTSRPTEFLDVHGTTKVTGLVTTTNLYARTATFGNALVTGIMTASIFYGSAAGLTGFYAIATDGWVVDGANSGIYTSFKVGFGTTNPQYSLQVGQNPTTGNGFSVDALTGDVRTSGSINAPIFIGSASASSLTIGTVNNARLPSNISISGIITATSGFVGNVTGNLIGISSSAISLYGTPDIQVGIITASKLIVDTIEVTAAPSGITTISKTLHVGTGGTAFSALESGRIGVGTAIPTSEFQIRKASNSLMEVISESGQSRISIGQDVGVGKSTAVLRFGNVSKTFDIINNDTGSINYYLHAGASGIGTGRFSWFYGQTNSELLSLTYGGRLGIGITNPTNSLHVVGTSTVTSNSYVGNDLYVANDIYFKTLRSGIIETNINVTSGISTFSTVYLNGGSNVLTIGTNNPEGYNFKIADNLDAYLGTKSRLGTQSNDETIYFANNLAANASLLKVFGGLYTRTLYVANFNPNTLTVGTASSASLTVGTGTTASLTVGMGITASSGIVTATNGFSSGIGTAVKITTDGDRIYFTVVGVGSTSLQLF